MPAKKPDPLLDARILRASQAGLASGELAARFGLSPGSIRAAVARAKAAAGATAARPQEPQEARP